MIEQIQPFVTTCAVLIQGVRHSRRRLEVQTALQKSEADLSHAQRIASIGSWTWDPSTDLMEWSEGLYHVFGADRVTVEPTRETFLGFIHPHDRQKVRDALDSLAREEPTTDLVHRVALFESYSEVGQLEYDAARTESGAVRVIGTLQNVTEANRSKRALQISEERLRQAMRVANVGIFDHDHIADTLYWSQSQRDIHGWGPEDTVSLSDFLSLVHPDDFQTIEAAVKQAHDPAGDGLFDVEHRIVRPSGEVRWTSTRSRTTFSDFGGKRAPVRTIGAVIDITESRRNEHELAERAEALSKSNAELEQFAYVASHDLQEPLRKVRAFAELLEAEAEQGLSEQARGYIDRMSNASKRMQQLIRDLLAYSQASDAEGSTVPVDLSGVIREVTEDLELRLSESGCQVIVGDLPTVQAHPLQVRQLFQNLLGNSLKYRRLDVPPVIRISARRTERSDLKSPSESREWWEIRVSDNGIGVEPRHRDRIFGVFQRLHGRQEYEGTGIGLSICRKIVDRYGGRIWAEDGDDGGLSLVFELPVGHTSAAAAPLAAEQEGRT